MDRNVQFKILVVYGEVVIDVVSSLMRHVVLMADAANKDVNVVVANVIVNKMLYMIDVTCKAFHNN